MTRVLEVIIEDYIRSGEAVGSRTVSEKSDLALSSASIRNIMSDLERLGFLYQPHTSAGRVPTEQGFRFYVDNLLSVQELSQIERQKLRAMVPDYHGAATEFFRETSRMLSSTSHYLGVVWAPRVDLVILQHIEFVKLRKHLVLALMVGTSGMVQNRIIEVEEDFTQSELDHLSDYMNGFLAGLTLQQVRDKIIEQMRVVKSAYDRLLEQALGLGEKAFSSLDEPDVFIEGRTNIFEELEFGSVSQMKDLFRTFEEKAIMVSLLDKCLDPQGVKIAIGSESKIQAIEPCSLVTSTYSYRGKVLGALGVIGPRRMDYSRVVPLVDYTAQLLTEILEAP